METYTVIKKGATIQHCLDLPEEFADKDLKITVSPIRTSGGYKKKIESLFNKHKNVRPFNSIPDPMQWQKESRSDW